MYVCICAYICAYVLCVCILHTYIVYVCIYVCCCVYPQIRPSVTISVRMPSKAARQFNMNLHRCCQTIQYEPSQMLPEAVCFSQRVVVTFAWRYWRNPRAPLIYDGRYFFRDPNPSLLHKRRPTRCPLNCAIQPRHELSHGRQRGTGCAERLASHCVLPFIYCVFGSGHVGFQTAVAWTNILKLCIVRSCGLCMHVLYLFFSFVSNWRKTVHRAQRVHKECRNRAQRVHNNTQTVHEQYTKSA
jgi:hypothetical protein